MNQAQSVPHVSIILTSFNHAKFLREAIESVLHQTYTDFELIIWDDCSTDESRSIIESYTDQRIRFFSNQFNKGPTYGVNEAIFKYCAGQYIAIHHSDDVWLPEKLATQVDFLETNLSIGAVFSAAEAIDERGKPLLNSQHFYNSIFSQPNRTRHDWLRYFLLSGNALCHPSLLIRKQCYEKVGTYRGDLFQLPDFEMWVRLCSYFDIHVIEEPLLRFRVLDGERNTSGDRPDTRSRAMFERMRIMETFESHLALTDLRKMFPEITRLNEIPTNDVGLGLAAIVLDTHPFPSAQLYALNKIASYLQNDVNALTKTDTEAADWPKLQDLYKITGLTDVFGLKLQEQIATKLADTLRLQSQVTALEDAIHTIKQSNIWKMTAPLRAVSDLLRRTKT